jgi:hypothetical protein
LYGRGVLINAYATHRDPPTLDFPHDLRGRRDLSDPELGPHLHGFMGFIMDGGERPMTATRYAVLRHIERVRHQFAFEIEPEHMRELARWAQAANAILFHTDDSTVRAPNRKVLVDPATGDPEPGAAVPYPVDAAARKATTDKQLADRSIQVPAHLPPYISEIEVELRDARDVASRVLALFVCAARAEGLAANEPLAVDMMRERVPLGFAAMSPKETAFMMDEQPAKQDVVNHVWRYEAIVPLAWSLGLVDMPFPSAICDVPGLAKTMFALKGDDFVASARLRPVSEILDALDVTFRLHWAVTDARINWRAVVGVEAGAVVERHHALNWLTRFEEAEWDDVTTPT